MRTPYLCTVCKKQFQTKSELESHQPCNRHEKVILADTGKKTVNEPKENQSDR